MPAAVGGEGAEEGWQRGGRLSASGWMLGPVVAGRRVRGM